MSKWRKRPVVIEAFKWSGDEHQTEDPTWIVAGMKSGEVYFEKEGTPEVVLKIKTREGVMTADRGDYVIQGIQGELYPCKPDIFEATYELEHDTPLQELHPATKQLLQFFEYAHLPPHLQEHSRPFAELARRLTHTLPSNPELTAALRKLLEAKDCTVRARIAKA